MLIFDEPFRISPASLTARAFDSVCPGFASHFGLGECAPTVKRMKQLLSAFMVLNGKLDVDFG